MRYLLNRYHARMAAKYIVLANENIASFHLWYAHMQASRRHSSLIR